MQELKIGAPFQEFRNGSHRHIVDRRGALAAAHEQNHIAIRIEAKSHARGCGIGGLKFAPHRHACDCDAPLVETILRAFKHYENFARQRRQPAIRATGN